MSSFARLHTWLVDAAHRSVFLRLLVYLREIGRLLRRKPDDFALRTLVGLFPAWQSSLKSEASALAAERPWLTYGATRFLEQTLTADMRVFEFGAGGSTLFFARRVREGYSVEHDAAWCAAVRRRLGEAGFSNWRVELAEPTEGIEVNGRTPAALDGYVSSDASYAGVSFRAYASVIDRHPDESFDIVMIDGRARPSCFRHAVSKVRPGGYIVLDNADRPHYAGIHESLDRAGWRKRTFDGPGPYSFDFWQTCIWTRAR